MLLMKIIVSFVSDFSHKSIQIKKKKKEKSLKMLSDESTFLEVQDQFTFHKLTYWTE